MTTLKTTEVVCTLFCRFRRRRFSSLPTSSFFHRFLRGFGHRRSFRRFRRRRFSSVSTSSFFITSDVVIFFVVSFVAFDAVIFRRFRRHRFFVAFEVVFSLHSICRRRLFVDFDYVVFFLRLTLSFFVAFDVDKKRRRKNERFQKRTKDTTTSKATKKDDVEATLLRYVAMKYT